MGGAHRGADGAHRGVGGPHRGVGEHLQTRYALPPRGRTFEEYSAAVLDSETVSGTGLGALNHDAASVQCLEGSHSMDRGYCQPPRSCGRTWLCAARGFAPAWRPCISVAGPDDHPRGASHDPSAPVPVAGHPAPLPATPTTVLSRTTSSPRRDACPEFGGTSAATLHVRLYETPSADRLPESSSTNIAVACTPQRIAAGSDPQSGPSLLSFSTSVVRLMRNSSAALLRFPPVRSSER